MKNKRRCLLPLLAGLLAWGEVSAQTATYTNPVFATDSPDPTIQRDQDGNFWCYATNCQTRRSTDLVHWTRVDGVFTTPTWNGPGYAVWAADVNFIDERYVMYYALALWGNESETGIGVAVGDTPRKFTDVGRMFRSKEIGVQNSIDACYVEEGDKKYLVWGSFHGIYVTELTEDGLAVKNFARKTKIAGGAFEGSMIYKRGGYYYLFASVGSCCEGGNSTYRTVVGRSTKLLGPYVNKQGGRMLDNNYTTIIRGNSRWAGPGHNSEILTDDNGDDWIMYHSYDAKNGYDGRLLLLDKITWDAQGWPSVNDGYPSSTEMPAPVFYKGNGANMTYRMRNMDLAQSDFRKWETTQGEGVTLKNGISVGSVHMPLMKAADGSFSVTQTCTGLPDGLYELCLHNFCTQGGAQVVMNGTATPAHNAANDDVKAPSNASAIAVSFLNRDLYRQRVYGMVSDGTLTVSLQGSLAQGEAYYAGNLNLIYRDKDSTACAAVLDSYKRSAQECIASTDVFYEGYRTRLADNVAKAEAAEDSMAMYEALHDMAVTLDCVRQSTSLYAAVGEETARLEEEIAYARNHGLDVDASLALVAEARQACSLTSYDDTQVKDLITRLQQGVRNQSYVFLGGDGTADSPYLIGRAPQLDHIHDVAVQGQMTYFKLTADIDLAGYVWTPLNGASDKYSFWIDLDGDGHIIRNFTPADRGRVGFFSTLCGNVRNVGFVDAQVVSSVSAAGIVAGYLGDDSYTDAEGNVVPSVIENCYVTGRLEGKGYIGAVAGMVPNGGRGRVENVYTNVEVAGVGGTSNYAGGLLGRVRGEVRLARSYAAGSVQSPVCGGVLAGGQMSSSPASEYDNVIAWNRSVDGDKAVAWGNLTSRDITRDLCVYDGLLLNGSPVEEGVNADALHTLCGAWGAPWHADTRAGNGYPILQWQYARGDHKLLCGFPLEDGVSAPRVDNGDGEVRYYNLQGQRLARPHRGVVVERKGAASRTRVRVL